MTTQDATENNTDERTDNLLENINEFNNQLSQWRNRIEIDSDSDHIQEIRETLDQTRSMVTKYIILLSYIYSSRSKHCEIILQGYLTEGREYIRVPVELELQE